MKTVLSNANFVVVIAAAVFAVEAAYFNRQSMKEGVRQVEKRL